MSTWMKLPAQLRTALVGAALLVIGAATEVAVAWLTALGQAAGA